jgi:myo-inositol-1(or 4)-monophosphatase
MDDLTLWREAACEAARRAAQVLSQLRGRIHVQEKGHHADLVSEADLNAQQVIRSYLQERFPGQDFLGEEGEGPKHRPRNGSPPTWIVDPLDGTTNYVHDLPLYCVSIGLEVAGELAVGVVYDPTRDEMFHAAKGQGAWLNRQRIRTSQASTLGRALLATGFPADVRSRPEVLDWWRYFSFRARSLRRLGSTAINLCWLAAGRLDGFYAFDNNVWDVAGGVVIVREAGGVVTNADGSGYDPYTPDCAASNGPLHAELVAALRGSPREE